MIETILSIGAGLTHPLALTGFLSAAFFLLLRQLLEMKIFPELPSGPAGDLLRLVVNRAFVLVLIALLTGFAGTVLGMLGDKPKHSKEEQNVLDLKKQVVDLRGTFETIDKYPHACSSVRREGPKLAHLMLEISDDSLSEAYEIVKYQYSAFALEMAASTEPDATQRTDLARRAVTAAEKTLDLIEQVRLGASGPHAAEAYKWVVEDEGRERTTWLLAKSLAILEWSKGSRDGGALERLSSIPAEYRARYDPEQDYFLSWALHGSDAASVTSIPPCKVQAG